MEVLNAVNQQGSVKGIGVVKAAAGAATNNTGRQAGIAFNTSDSRWPVMILTACL
jgi:hypothetical protein